jgi:N,N'-diacetylbacillosaminyl-diphospho-undecaprenol alpha-1,3-N-acetylgalactosaminyltransferase
MQEKKITFGFLSHLDLNLYLFRSPIMQELIKQGHIVYAICPEGDKNKALQELGCSVVNYEIKRESLNPLSEKRAIDSIYEAIKELHIDVLHTFTAKPNIYGTFAAKKAGIPIILNLVEGLGSFYVKDCIKNIIVRFVMERLYKKAFRLSDGCVFVNGRDAEYMVKKRIISKEKVKIIKSVGVDTQKFSMQNYTLVQLQTVRKKLGLENKIIILMVARAIWDKGVREYYEAAALVKQKYEDVAFLLAGGTDEGNPSCASETYLQTGVVKWLGYREDIADLTAVCDICVLPSYREGMPVTLMEAASMAKPIITTDTVGCNDVVEDEKNGFLVPIKDIEALAAKMEVLIQNKDLRYEMGYNGRVKALAEFDVRKVVKQYMEYYETFI